MNTQIEEAVVTEQPQAAIEKAVKKGMPAAVRVILCILLSAVLIADIFTIAAATAVRAVATEDNIEKLLDNTDYMAIPLTIDNIQSNLYEMFFLAFANASTEKVDIYKLAEETGFEKFIAEQLYNYAAFILYDERLEGIDSDIIMDFYDENSDKINRAFNVTYTRNEIREIIEGQDELFDRLTNNEIEASIPMIKLIRFVMSPAALIIFAILAAVIIALIGIISRSVGTPLVAAGISVAVAGFAGTAASYLVLFGKIGIAPTPVTAAGLIWQGFVSSVIPDVLTMFAYVLTAGILLVLTGGFIGQIRRNIRRAKNN